MFCVLNISYHMQVFSNPEEHEEMQPFLVSQTIRERDHNKDGRIDFKEYLGDRGEQTSKLKWFTRDTVGIVDQIEFISAAAHDKTWLVSEQDKFTHELDLDGDGALAENEVRRWIIPDNELVNAVLLVLRVGFLSAAILSALN